MDEVSVIKEIIDKVRSGEEHVGHEYIEWIDELEAKDLDELAHNVIPSAVRDVLDKLGVTYKLYHLKDDVRLPEYILVIDDSVVVELELTHECNGDMCYGTLLIGDAYPISESIRNVLVHYHEI